MMSSKWQAIVRLQTLRLSKVGGVLMNVRVIAPGEWMKASCEALVAFRRNDNATRDIDMLQSSW